ncbi:MAG: hypothetical protein WBQ94_03665 [Terracidiphilus sp.]
MIKLNAKAKWVKFNHPMGGDWYRWGDVSVHVAMEDGLWHISISVPYRYPTWDEIYTAWYELVPGAENIQGAIILPRKAEYVNIHSNCFHVHQLTDAEIGSAKVIL